MNFKGINNVKNSCFRKHKRNKKGSIPILVEEALKIYFNHLLHLLIPFKI